MYCWGSSVNGELGLGGIEEEHILSPRLLKKPWAKEIVHSEWCSRRNIDQDSFMTVIRFSVSSGNHHTVFVTKSGRIYSCGSDDCGQLGHTKDTRKRPEKIDALEDHDIVTAACGGSYTLALNSEGQIFAWGSNTAGQLGFGKADESCVSKPTFLRAFGGKRVVQIAAGDQHSVALVESKFEFLCLQTGELFAWGSNNHGQLGIGKKGGQENFPVPIKTLEGVPVKQIACGHSHTVILTRSGGLFACGNNHFGQLGIDDESDRHFPSLLRTIRSHRVSYISAGGDHTVALTKSGGVFTFGAGMYGQLGHGSTANEILPRRVLELMGSEVTQIACGRRHTLAFIASRGRLYAFGLGGSGQLGTKTGKNSWLPVVVPGPWKSPQNSSDFTKVNDVDSDDAGYYKAVYSGGDQSFVSVTPMQTCDEELDEESHRNLPNISLQEGYEPRDFRKFLPSTQVLTFSGEFMRKILTRGANAPISSLDTARVESIASTPTCLNASFLKQGSHYGCGSKNVGIDMNEVRELWETVGAIKNEVLLKTLRKGLKSAVEKLPSSPPDVEALRIYVLLPFYHEFSDPAQKGSFQIPFARSVMALPTSARRVIGIWWSTVSPELFFRILTIYKTVIQTILKNSAAGKDGNRTRMEIDYLKISLEVLAMLNTLVKDHRLQIKPQEFYIEELNDYADIAKDYIRRRYTPSKEPDMLYFCNYPFIFDAASKTVLLQTDAALQMHSAMNEAQIIMFPFPHVDMQNQFMVFIVTRENIVRDTLCQLLKAPAEDLKKPLRIVFAGEEAVDAGGVRKEFFILLMRELLDPKYGMFFSYPETNVVWFSEETFEDTSMYFLVGVICGLAIYNFTIIDLPFPLAMYKKLLGEEVGLDDIRDLSPVMEKTLRELLEYEGEDVEENYALAFEITRESFGETKTIELKPGGSNIPVNKENKKEYVDLYVKYILDTSIESSFTAFYKGFHYVCGSYILSLFKAEELMELVVGNEDYDWDQLEKSSEYKNGYTKDDPTIRLFWQVFHGLTTDEKKRFLKFLTGTDRIPILGMKSVKLLFQPTGGGERYFPVAHTCFNLLDLPRYKSAQVLREKLLLAIQQTEGFTLV
ncbi:unnamed protein product [Notodromas monacha]|uniref:HECT domain-containing protein n=1 Tax=Notodromas monacha TaxID=399045 RepID=A0A7R9BTS5_9CRUS|nr:unnamed protein product [Notodromas monacha]CAG0920580.1 unnamed protein product [Notodromas monacha]